MISSTSRRKLSLSSGQHVRQEEEEEKGQEEKGVMVLIWACRGGGGPFLGPCGLRLTGLTPNADRLTSLWWGDGTTCTPGA